LKRFGLFAILILTAHIALNPLALGRASGRSSLKPSVSRRNCRAVISLASASFFGRRKLPYSRRSYGGAKPLFSQRSALSLSRRRFRSVAYLDLRAALS